MCSNCGYVQKKLIAEVFQATHLASNKLPKKRQERLLAVFMCKDEDPDSSQSFSKAVVVEWGSQAVRSSPSQWLGSQGF